MDRITHPKFNRFKDAVWFPEKFESVVVGGAGGIGSWITLLLTRANFSCVVFDNDTVEPHNLGGQLFSYKSIGKPKVAALEDTVKELTDIGIVPMQMWYTASCITNEVVFSCFDNMEARKIMFDKWYKVHKDNPKAIFIDGRLGFENMQIFCVTPDRADMYREHLFKSSDVADEVCTLKQTTHAATMIASHMMGFFSNHRANQIEPDSREVPFYWSYFIPLDYLTTETPEYAIT